MKEIHSFLFADTGKGFLSVSNWFRPVFNLRKSGNYMIFQDYTLCEVK